MADTPTAPDATAQTAPLQDRPQVGVEGSAGATPGVGRLVALVRWIIGYGQELAATLQQGADPRRFAHIGYRFQTIDLAAILARITRGLLLAGGLEARLKHFRDRGHEVHETPVRLPSMRAPRAASAGGEPRACHTNIIDLPLDRLPSAEAIAAELLRRPLGAVLVDICRDLCIQAGDLPAGRWKELADAVMAYGGNMATLMFACPSRDKAFAEARRRIAGLPPGPDWVVPPIPSGEAMLPIGLAEFARRPVAA